MHNHESSTNVYRVKVGHTEVIVRASSVKNAIAAARRELTLDMPRFYDIIRDLDTTRFVVQDAA